MPSEGTQAGQRGVAALHSANKDGSMGYEKSKRKTTPNHGRDKDGERKAWEALTESTKQDRAKMLKQGNPSQLLALVPEFEREQNEA
eukprot:4868490-Pleurochrysis_carterae.AAC.2